jgi:hypothetical protein
MTSAQEIGWEQVEGLNSIGRLPKNTCEETRYANKYYSLQKRSPYATKDLTNKKE